MGKGKQFSKVDKERIGKLVKEGKSQYNIAITLHVRKQRIATYLKRAKIGKRAAEGARVFWKDVKKMKEITGMSRKRAIKEVKFGDKWYRRKVERLGARAKARYEMKKKWYDISKGEIERDYWEQAGGEELLESAQYE